MNALSLQMRLGFLTLIFLDDHRLSEHTTAITVSEL